MHEWHRPGGQGAKAGTSNEIILESGHAAAVMWRRSMTLLGSRILGADFQEAAVESGGVGDGVGDSVTCLSMCRPGRYRGLHR